MQFTATDLKPLFANWARIMQAQRDHLIELDSIVGDGDLGLTMSDGFLAAFQVISTSDEQDIGKFFYSAGKAMSIAVPSTMGTLMASGLMQIGKVFKGKTTFDETEFASLFSAYFDGVQLRGKAAIGEKTFLDGLYPAIQTLHDKNNNDWKLLANKAYESAKQGVLATQTMTAVHGRAATRGEDSKKLLDPGAFVAQLLLQGYSEFANN